MICSRISKSTVAFWSSQQQKYSKWLGATCKHCTRVYRLAKPLNFHRGNDFKWRHLQWRHLHALHASKGWSEETHACSSREFVFCTFFRALHGGFFYFSTNGMPVRRSANGNTASGVLICVPLEMVNFRSEFDSIYCGRCPDARYYWKS